MDRCIFHYSGRLKPGRVVAGLILLLALGAVLARADQPLHRVGLVVSNGEEVIKKCVEFSEEEIDGYEVLKRAGFDLGVDASSMGAAICRIDNQGCAFPEEHCFCQCQGSPCRFWIYWHLIDDEWQFSGLGASNYKVRDGDVEGWIWGEGSPNSGGDRPPSISFEEICAEPPTPTPTPIPPTDTPSPTPQPTPTSEPTSTPEPTETPLPIATPVIHHFTADRSTIKAGESAVLSWDLSDAEAAYLHYDGLEEGVVAPGSKTVSPGSTTTYTLVARNDGGETVSEITITVDASSPVPTSAPAPNLAPTAVPALAAAPPPDAAPVAEPVIRFAAGAQALPAGACTTLAWEVQQASALYLDDTEVSLQGAQEVCPTESRIYTLRAAYPGGERVAQLTLSVFEVTQPSLEQPALTPLPSPTPAASPDGALAPSATPTAAALALAPSRSLRPASRNFTSATERQVDSEAGQVQRLLAYAGIAAALFLFLAAPVALLAVGWVAWWLRRRR
jgi:hypothetical protein